ncbi:hypothetical protein ACP275_14G086400 [Erythranthe tilingii]
MGRSITTTFLCFFVLISLVIPKGLSQDDNRCPSKAIEIVQIQTSTTEWKVSVTNTCSCSVYHVKLLCPKFESVVVSKNDQSVISEIGKSGVCLFNNGNGFVGDAVTFTYSGERVDLALDTYDVACS